MIPKKTPRESVADFAAEAIERTSQVIKLARESNSKFLAADRDARRKVFAAK